MAAPHAGQRWSWASLPGPPSTDCQSPDRAWRVSRHDVAQLRALEPEQRKQVSMEWGQPGTGCLSLSTVSVHGAEGSGKDRVHMRSLREWVGELRIWRVRLLITRERRYIRGKEARMNPMALEWNWRDRYELVIFKTGGYRNIEKCIDWSISLYLQVYANK